MADKPDTDNGLNFEQSLADLERLVGDLESGDLSLEESMKAFEKGIGLTRRAQQTLAAAEQKVQLLVEQEGEPVAQPFAEEGEDS